MTEQFVYSQKNSFSGGELTPTMEGRTDLGLYHNGVRKLINYVILPTGGIMRRHGSQFVHIFEENVPRQMLTVMFSRKLSYLLVFEAHIDKTTVSVFVDGSSLLTTQVIKHSGEDFTFHINDFSSVVFQGIAYISFGSHKPVFTFSVDPEIVEKFYEHIDKAKSLKSEDIENRRNILEDFPQKDEMFIIKPLLCEVSYFVDDRNEKDSKPFSQVIKDFEVDEINEELKKIRDGQGNQNIHKAEMQNLPCSKLATFANRLWCFGANENIHSIWASYKGNFTDFNMAYSTLLEARNPLSAFSATFSSGTFDNVLWTIPFASELLLATTDGIYIVKEGNREKCEFVIINKEIELPVSPIKPVILGKTIFFVEGNNRKINSLFYSQEKGGFQTSCITDFAESLFASGIKAIAGSNSPFSMIFAILKDGSFATFTYSQDLTWAQNPKVMGWTRHYLGGDAQVLDMAVVYADNEDRLYFHARRPTATGKYREYMEVLSTRYFSGKISETQKPVYADCHISINSWEEEAANNRIEAIINNDTAHEFRGDITKLENIIQELAQNLLRLNTSQIDIGQSFRYDNKLVAEHEENAEAIAEFLKNYYSDYSPQIFETLGATFAYYRLFGKIYAELENIFIDEPEKLPTVESLLHDGQKLKEDVTNVVENVISVWQVPEILQTDKIVEYLPNRAFSFNPQIIPKLKNFNTQVLEKITAIAEEIITRIKSFAKKRFEGMQELKEMRSAVAKLNASILKYYSQDIASSNNGKDLVSVLRDFFKNSPLNFYYELLNLAHPALTPYIFSNETRETVKTALAGINEGADLEEAKEAIKNAVASLLERLSKIYDEQKFESIASHKRQSEIVELIRAALLEQETRHKEYIFSDELSEFIDEVMEEATAGDLASVAGSVHSVQSEQIDEQLLSHEVSVLMEQLQDVLREYKRQIIDYCPLVMPNHHPSLLKNILEDQSTIKLEKYLLLSKRYFSLFKKLFPDIGVQELGTIAKNALPARQEVEVSGVLSIYENMPVAIIGDEELHGVQILAEEVIKMQHPVRNIAIGFPYRSVMQTFPFVFPEEVEHMPKTDVEIGLKLFNAKGGYIEIKHANGRVERQHINSKYLDTDALARFTGEKKYLAVKEVSSILATPYKSGWVYFLAGDHIKTDIECSFVVDKPYPAGILKMYAKAKILPNYKGL